MFSRSHCLSSSVIKLSRRLRKFSILFSGFAFGSPHLKGANFPNQNYSIRTCLRFLKRHMNYLNELTQRNTKFGLGFFLLSIISLASEFQIIKQSRGKSGGPSDKPKALAPSLGGHSAKKNGKIMLGL